MATLQHKVILLLGSHLYSSNRICCTSSTQIYQHLAQIWDITVQKEVAFQQVGHLKPCEVVVWSQLVWILRNHHSKYFHQTVQNLQKFLCHFVYKSTKQIGGFSHHHSQNNLQPCIKIMQGFGVFAITKHNLCSLLQLQAPSIAY